MIKFTEDHEAMLTHTERRVTRLEEHAIDATGRLAMLENFKKECDELHRNGEVKQRRQEDATNRNTESTILLAKAVADINITITKLVQSDEESRPAVKFYKDIGTVWTFNKKLWATVVSLAVGVAAIASAWKVWG